MDLLNLIQSARNPEEIKLLLAAMGQSSAPTAQATARPAVDPMATASAEALMSPAIAPQDVEAMRALLASMGQTGAMAKPATPQASYSNEGRNSPKPSPQQNSATGSAGSVEEITPLIDQIMGKAPAAPAEPMSTGVNANTKHGAARVNEFSSMHGVTATTDPKTGRVTLTNIGADGAPTQQSQKQVYGFNPLTSSTSSSVNSLLEDLNKAQDVDTAQGIAASLRTSLAEERTAIKNEAIKAAEREHNVAEIKANLRAAESLDQSRSGWMPGIGDSSNTLAMRKKLAEVQGNVEASANRYLAGNIGYARLTAAEANAKESIDRIVTKGAAQERKVALIQERADATDAAKKEKAKADYDGLTPTQKQLIIRINPSLGGEGKEQETIAFVNRQAKTDKDFVGIVQADPTEYKALAFSGNKYAAQLLASEEAARTGQKPEDIEKQIKELAIGTPSTAAVQDYILRKSGQVIGDKSKWRTEETARWNTLLAAKTPEEKVARDAYAAEVKIEAYKKAQSAAFVGNVLNWAGPSSPLRVAGQKALSTTGKADLRSALAIMTEGQDAPTAIATLKGAKEEIMASVATRKNSVFGGIDTLAALKEVDDAVTNSEGIRGMLRDLIISEEGRVRSGAALAIGGAPGIAASSIYNLMNF